MSVESASILLDRATPATGSAALARRRKPPTLLRLRSHRWITLWSVLGSVALTALMSAFFNHGTVRPDMIVTGAVCALVMDPVVGRITRHYRRRLAAANAALERRVHERTADLAAANSSLRQAAAAQAALRDELLIRDRLATAGMLAAGVSHELRSPLTVLVLGLEELDGQLGADAPADVGAVLADVRAASAQLEVVVRDLSSLARPAGEPVAPVELGPVIASAVRLARYQLGPGAAVAVGALTATPVVGNAARLVQVVLNLVLNAARATRPDVANTIAITAEAQADVVVLRLVDHGSGMSAETQARLFQPFFTTGADRGGTGLGLSICKALVEAMGGAIAVRSALDHGTTVEVTLQRADRAHSSRVC